MGVKVTRKFSNGRSTTTDYVCFGFLADENDINSDVVELQYHFSLGFNTSRWGSQEAYTKVMADLFAGNPMFKHCKVHPRKGVIAVKNVDSIPCDQLMACMFAARNMAQNSTCIDTYKYLNNLGFSPIVSFTMCQIFVRKNRLGSLDGEANRWSRWSQCEASMIHQATFGELAFKSMIRQGYSKKIFKPWKQETFPAQRRYLRDSLIHREWGAVSHVLDERGRSGRLNTDHSNYMSFCFSDFSGKEKPLIQGKTTQNRLSDAEVLQWLNSMLPKRLRVNLDELPSEAPSAFVVGASVFMSDRGANRYDSSSNPNSTTVRGEIIRLERNGRYWVSWINGMQNSYLEGDLVISA